MACTWNTAAGFYTRLRHVMAEELATASPVAGEVEVDESYFGGVRKGQRGRGAAGKVPVFGLFKHGGKVYTVMIPNVRTATLRPMIERMIRPDSIVYTDGFRSDDALDVSAASAKEGHVKVSDDVGSPVGSSERPDEAILGRAAESHEGVAKCAATLSGRKQAYSREGRRRSAQVPRKRGWDRTHVIVLGANPVRFI